MEVYEVTGFKTGVDRAGVNFLDPADAFEVIRNGYIYRQVLQSRLGFAQFGNQLDDLQRVMGIFSYTPLGGIPQLIVFSRQHVYRYNTATDAFDVIPFSATILGLNPGYTLNISANDDYISATSYIGSSTAAPIYTPVNRLVFTSKGIAQVTGGSGVLFYDGAFIRDFFVAADNPNMQQPAASIGLIIRSTYISNFGQRLNLFAPQTTVQTYDQGVLYSAINDNSGNGDKYNVAGAGLIQADNQEILKSATNLGEMSILNFTFSSWALEKTRDAFNPYFVRKIPSVIGTDAGFSAVQWNYEVKSAGKSGMITCDGRQSLRFDNKIPLITSDEFDQENFELTYGGFDRINGQFLFAYRDDFSNLAPQTQDKVLIYNYEESTWAVNDQRFSVFGQTDVGQSLTWDDIDGLKDPSWARWDDTEETWNSIGIENENLKILAGDNDGFVYQINQDYDDYFTSISGITNAPSAVVTIPATNFQIGDRVIIRGVASMPAINNEIFTILAVTPTTITLNVDSTLFGAYLGGGNVSKTIEFEAPMSPFNPYRKQGRKVYISHVEFLLNTGSSDLTAEFYEDEEETPFKTVLLAPQDNSSASIVGINLGVTTSITIYEQNFTLGEEVILSGILGTIELNGQIAKIIGLTNSTIILDIDSSTYTPYISGGSVSNAYPTTKQRQWITAIVDQESNFITISMHNETTGNQTIVTSIRIHCSPGAYTAS